MLLSDIGSRRGILWAPNEGGGGANTPAANKPGGEMPPAAPGGQEKPAGGEMSLEQALTELEKARKALKDVNAESASRRKRLDELETAETQRQQAQMSEAEKATAAAQKLADDLAARDAALAALRQQMVRYEVMLAAQSLNIVDPDAAVTLLLADPAAVKCDEAGRPTNAAEALKALVEQRPWLVKVNTGSVGLGTPPGKQRTSPPGDGEQRQAFEDLVRRQVIR